MQNSYFAGLAMLCGAASLSACSPDLTPKSASQAAPIADEELNDIAQSFVQLSLEAGAHEDGYIDAYYGPAEWQQAALANPRPVATLAKDAREIIHRLDGLRSHYAGRPLETQRIRALRAQLIAAETRLHMMQGQRFSFLDEAERLFGVRPALKPLESYDPLLKKLDQSVAGTGPLPDRIEAMAARYTISKEHLQPVFERAIALCRAKSAQHIPMPDGESFALAFVTDKSWSGYNYYQGNFHSKIDVNTDFPIRLPRAIDLGCHEGYPGHHLLNMKLEQNLVRGRGWQEYSVYPLYSPLSFIAEGSANYGIRLAFPADSKKQIEQRMLMPLAHLPADSSDIYWQVQEGLAAISGARMTIAQQYLDGEIDRATAVSLSQKYLALTPERADQSIRFTEQYRSYVINYGLGETLVRNFVEAGGANEARKWQRMAAIISEPTLPADLLP